MTATRQRLPPWFRTALPAGEAQRRYRATAARADDGLHTVCREARCPNQHECWGHGTATFLIGGRYCTRGCRFCAVETRRRPPPPDPAEPQRLAEAVAAMKLRYAVLTVVDRDDLPDAGAAHFRACLDAVRARCPEVGLELLGSDLGGDDNALAHLLDGAPLTVFTHNVECVARLTPVVRDPRASFAQSVRVLRRAGELRPDVLIKSGFMVGLGETDGEVSETLRALRDAGVALVTIGQYLAPGDMHHPVDRYPPPERFAAWADEARSLGFVVASGPLVRSSYRAGELAAEAQAEA